jgi:hypothetical protein
MNGPPTQFALEDRQEVFSGNDSPGPRLSPSEVDILNQNVIALIQHDRDDLVRDFLAAMKEADGVLSQNVAQKLAGYP